MLGHPLHAGRGEIPLGHHRQVRLHGLRREIVADRHPQPLGEQRPTRTLAPPAGEPGSVRV
jgi:hypothetical protein